MRTVTDGSGPGRAGGYPRPVGPTSTSRRDLAALAAALLVHALLLVYVKTADERRVFERHARAPVVVELVTPGIWPNY